jgi:type VI protein secretion system component Hcp
VPIATTLKVEITLFKTTVTGSSVPGFKLTLTGALLTRVETSYDPGATPSALERLQFVYTKLTWTDLTTGATGSAP